ncbi:hypothetical protein ACFWCA_49895 [Streptomyces phaeochromogenes]|uniref:hypothetical protein n=1 Tax=Streptomyces phaeochromogenes TaxID=1923 RepID=UPI00368ACD8D
MRLPVHRPDRRCPTVPSRREAAAQGVRGEGAAPELPPHVAQFDGTVSRRAGPALCGD